MTSEASMTSIPISFPSALKSACTPGTTVTVLAAFAEASEK
jgi:hypothetical protein